MKPINKYETSVGDFYIAQSSDGRFSPVFDGESLGCYAKPWQAAEDLAGGHTFSPSNGVDISSLGIAEHHSELELICE